MFEVLFKIHVQSLVHPFSPHMETKQQKQLSFQILVVVRPQNQHIYIYFLVPFMLRF